MKINFRKIILVGITGKDENDLIAKIKEADEMKIKEVSLFLEFLDKEQKQKVYAELLKSKIKSIPLVHIRDGMSKDELKFLKTKFKTKYFTIHEINFQNDDILKWKGFYKNLCLEMNFDNFVSRKVKVEKIDGFCVDLAHFKVAMEKLTKDFDYVYIRKNMPKYFDCNHLNGWNPETNCDMHTIHDLKNFDYLKTLPNFLFSKCIALETFNSVREQIEFKTYLTGLLTEKFYGNNK
jgi:hypothetical protein